MEIEPQITHKSKSADQRFSQGVDALRSKGFTFEVKGNTCVFRESNRVWADYYPHTGRWRTVGKHSDEILHEGGVAKFAKWWKNFDLDPSVGPCPYCGAPLMVSFEKTIYRRSFTDRGLVICCSQYPFCDALTGWSPGGLYYGVPVVVADRAGRHLRVRAHEWFDRLWKGPGAMMSRKEAYRRLADRFGLPPERAHIKLLSDAECKRLIAMVRKRIEVGPEIDSKSNEDDPV